ncbi:MAG: amidohydrolase [Acidobacteria bacterium]|nr:amidohydrolase [Acidobacteriota bacterium]
MIVDSHIHLITDTTGWYAYKKKAGVSDANVWDVEAIVRLMDEVGFDRCFLLTLAGLYGFNDHRKANDQIAAAVRRFPDRLIGFATTYPNQDPDGAARELLRSIELGLKGLKFHPWLQSFPANSAYLYPCLEVCSKYRIPVLFHTGTPPYSQPFQVMEQARRFPEAPFIIGHFGKLLFLDAVRSAELCPNVYLETSGAQVADLEFALERIGAERILFGTDLPIGGAPAGKWNLEKIRSAPLTEAQQRLILGENAIRLIGEGRA